MQIGSWKKVLKHCKKEPSVAGTTYCKKQRVMLDLLCIEIYRRVKREALRYEFNAVQ